MTKEQLGAIWARLASASPAPWRTEEDTGTPWNIEAADGGAVAIAQQLVGDAVRDKQPQRTANAAFIAHAPDDIAALLEEVDRLRAFRDQVAAIEMVACDAEAEEGAAVTHAEGCLWLAAQTDPT